MECMQTQNRIKVIGIGPNGETFYKNYILEADIIVGGKRLLNFFKFQPLQKIVVLGKNLSEALNELKKEQNSQIVILGSGDPLFFGIGKRLINIFGKDKLQFYPYLNSIQILASKVKIDYSNIVFYSVHGRDFQKERLLSLVKYNSKVGILTDKNNNINLIISTLKNSYLKLDNAYIVIGQMLGTEQEKVLSFKLNDVSELEPSDLDTVIVINESPDLSYRQSIEDNEFFHSKGLITKKEVRGVSISYLHLNMDSVLWDIGGGSGSISVEASSLCFKGKVFVIEKEPDRIKQINENLRKFNCHNVEVINGNAMDVIKKLPKPDRIFVGGFSGDIEEFLNYIKENFNEIIVVLNIVIIEKLYSIINWCRYNGVRFEVNQIQISNLNKIGENTHYFKSQNLINIVKLTF